LIPHIVADSLDAVAQDGIGAITAFPASGNLWTATGTPIDVTIATLARAETTAANSSIYLNETNDVTIAAAGLTVGGATSDAIISAGGSINAGTAGSIVLTAEDDLSLLTAGTGTLTLPAAGLSVGADPGGGTLHLVGDGDMVNSGGSPRTTSLTAGDLYLSSGSSGGDTTLTTTVTNLDAHLTNAAALIVNETDGITLRDVDTVNGNITVSSTTGNIVAVAVDDLDGTNTIWLDATAGAVNDGPRSTRRWGRSAPKRRVAPFRSSTPAPSPSAPRAVSQASPSPTPEQMTPAPISSLQALPVGSPWRRRSPTMTAATSFLPPREPLRRMISQ